MQGLTVFDMKAAFDRELHDLAQPIASCQCRLEIGLILGGEEALNEAATGGLEDLGRIIAARTRMRRLVEERETEPAA